MEIKDLRIGNYVYLLGSVTSITRSDFSETEYGIALDNAKPIPISHDWLVRFGLEKFSNDSVKRKAVFYYIKDFWVGEMRNEILCYDFVGCEIMYVHQFQNLYFSIMGKEINFSEKQD